MIVVSLRCSQVQRCPEKLRKGVKEPNIVSEYFPNILFSTGPDTCRRCSCSSTSDRVLERGFVCMEEWTIKWNECMRNRKGITRVTTFCSGCWGFHTVPICPGNDRRTRKQKVGNWRRHIDLTWTAEERNWVVSDQNFGVKIGNMKPSVQMAFGFQLARAGIPQDLPDVYWLLATSPVFKWHEPPTAVLYLQAVSYLILLSYLMLKGSMSVSLNEQRR